MRSGVKVTRPEADPFGPNAESGAKVDEAGLTSFRRPLNPPAPLRIGPPTHTVADSTQDLTSAEILAHGRIATRLASVPHDDLPRWIDEHLRLLKEIDDGDETQPLTEETYRAHLVAWFLCKLLQEFADSPEAGKPGALNEFLTGATMGFAVQLLAESGV